MHASENPNWNVRGEEVYGIPTNIGIFKNFNCIGPKTTIAALRVISEEDMANLIETGTSVIFDPTVAINWGTGFPPIPKVLSAGIRAGLGTNGASSNFGQDMFENMKNGIGVARTVDGSPNALPLNVALEMATIRNAELLGIDDQVGSLEVGKKADIITVALNKSRHSPVLNVLSATVLSASGRDVEEVIVDGRVLVKEGKLLGLDEQSIIDEANEMALFCPKKPISTTGSCLFPNNIR